MDVKDDNYTCIMGITFIILSGIIILILVEFFPIFYDLVCYDKMDILFREFYAENVLNRCHFGMGLFLGFIAYFTIIGGCMYSLSEFLKWL